MPNSSRKNRLPWTNWRAIASPPGMLVSDSTHMPPTGTNWPAATFSATRANTSGRCSLIQASCWAWDITKMNSGWSSISAVTLVAVRATFLTVSRSGHSQAESMWAWPAAETRCADAWAGVASAGASSPRAAAAVPGTSSRLSVSRARSIARRISQRRGPSTGSSYISWLSTSRSCTSSQTSVWKMARSARCRRYSGSSSAVGMSPSWVNGREMCGLAAASTKNRTAPAAGASWSSRTERCRGCRPRTGLPSGR